MESNSQAEIGKDIEKASCVEADDSELSHVSKQAGFLFRSATPSNTHCFESKQILMWKKCNSKQDYWRNKGPRKEKKKLSNSLIFELAVGYIFHLGVAPMCN